MASNDGNESKIKFEFRKVLLKISDRLSSENLRELKHLLVDQIAKVRLETAEQGIDIFNILDEQGLIKPEDLGFLRELLDVIERKDLCELIRVYEDRGSVAPPTTQRIYTEADLSDLLLGKIAKEIGKDWKMLSRHLGLPEYEIQSINQAYMFDLHEASFQALLRWKAKLGEKATVRALRRAFEDMRLMGIVQKYFDS